MAEIQLLHGGVAQVDEADLPLLNQFRWKEQRTRPDRVYATMCGRSDKAKHVWMHRFLLAATDGEEVDHIDGDTLNNGRANLRRCTHQENLRNTEGQRRRAAPYKGVTQARDGKSFRARITVNQKNIHLGCHATAEAAARAYDDAAMKLFGAFARPNFTNQPTE